MKRFSPCTTKKLVDLKRARGRVRRVEGRIYDAVVLTKGYPKRDDLARRLTLPWQGYRETTITHAHFGEEPVTVFAINVQLQFHSRQDAD